MLPPADFESAASTGSAIPARKVESDAGIIISPVRLSDFDFELPPELIAQHPAAERGASRLLHVAADGAIVDRMFRDLPSLA